MLKVTTLCLIQSTIGTLLWTKELPVQAVANEVLIGLPTPVETITGHFKGKLTKTRLDMVERLLVTLDALVRSEYTINRLRLDTK